VSCVSWREFIFGILLLLSLALCFLILVSGVKCFPNLVVEPSSGDSRAYYQALTPTKADIYSRLSDTIIYGHNLDEEACHLVHTNL
jgi:hypothetical protein